VDKGRPVSYLEEQCEERHAPPILPPKTEPTMSAVTAITISVNQNRDIPDGSLWFWRLTAVKHRVVQARIFILSNFVRASSTFNG
jgi:hypothetical protein